MRSGLVVVVSAILMLAANDAQAGIHLGMKLACKRYGEAWSSGSLGALLANSTSDFGMMWQRMPPETFASLPRSGGGRVLSSSKGRGAGTVTVATAEGVVTFLVVGRGFHWRVADIYKAGDDGRTVSLKNYLDASLTAREFMAALKYQGGESFHRSITSEFRREFAKLSDDQLTRVRADLPEIDPTLRPYLVLDDHQATMWVRPPGSGPDGYTRFSLVREGGWRVADMEVSTPETKIVSFRESLGTLGCLASFRRFVNHPGDGDPTTFVAPGSLQNSLLAIGKEKSFPLGATTGKRQLTIEGDGRVALVQYPGRTIRIHTEDAGSRTMIRQVEIQMGEHWNDLASMLVLRQSLKRLSVGGLLARAREPVATPTPIVVERAAATIPLPAESHPVKPAQTGDPGKELDLKPIPAAEVRSAHATAEADPPSERETAPRITRASYVEEWRAPRRLRLPLFRRRR